MKRILVFPCGSEIGLEVHRALKDQKDIELIGASSVDDHGKFVFDNYIGDIPMINDDNFLPTILKIVQEHNIDLIYPCMDIVITKLKNSVLFEHMVIGSPKETVNICQSKFKIYLNFENIIRTPKIYSLSENYGFPMFSKPDIGSSSRNAFKINDQYDLDFYSRKYPNNLLLEYLPGDEFTVDCFTDKKGILKFVSARKRNRITNGISVNVQLINNLKINQIAEKINNTLPFNGSWFFQLKEDKYGEFCLLEIASRFGGSSVIQRFLGVNLPYLNILNEYYPIEILKNDFSIEVDRSLDVKSKIDIVFDKIYIDFDDTIIINDKVNTDMIKLVYHFNNQNKKVILITKHKKSIHETLNKYKISEDIFSEIIHIEKNDKKYNYMDANGSIFIDDSFFERKEVKDNLDIPVFSVDSINCLW
jgi:hypothetical protein